MDQWNPKEWVGDGKYVVEKWRVATSKPGELNPRRSRLTKAGPVPAGQTGNEAKRVNFWNPEGPLPGLSKASCTQQGIWLLETSPNVGVRLIQPVEVFLLQGGVEGQLGG